MPALLGFEVTAVYVGLRAATEHADFQIRFEDGYACVGGIRSTGLTAVDGDRRARAWRARSWRACRARRARGAGACRNSARRSRGPMRDGERIAADPDYGRIVCFCERVTRGEIRDAFACPIPPADLDGLRRRTRAHMGRCQGFFCGAALAAQLEGRDG